jgi:hypothetical protein
MQSMGAIGRSPVNPIQSSVMELLAQQPGALKAKGDESGGRMFPSAMDTYKMLSGVGTTAIKTVAAIEGSKPSTNSAEPIDGLQSLMQSASGLSSSVGVSSSPSVIANGLRAVDGGLLLELERSAQTQGIGSPLRGLKLDGMSSTLLQNIGNLVHYHYPDGEPPIHRDPSLPASVTASNPTLTSLPVTHNVFDNDVPPDVQRAMDTAQRFQLPKVDGVPFHNINGF